MKDSLNKTSERIVQYIQKNRQASGNELADYLEITPRAVRKQLRKLHEKGIVGKIGKPPKVFYRLSDEIPRDDKAISLDKKTQIIINDQYLYISPTGDELSGVEGFIAWCAKTNQDPIKTAKEYVHTIQKYDRFKKGNLINGMRKLKQTFETVYLDKLFYLDFYSIERFGKTKLGQMLLYAKQSQDKKLIKRLAEKISFQIYTIVKKFDIDGILFIPPTVKRDVQLMFELEKYLRITIRALKVTKIKTPITIPQKTLSKLQDRISNAEQTFVVEDGGNYSNILVIDDAVGSGATMNEVAKQIKIKNICSKKIVGLAITGSFKGFDVISEV